MLFLDIDLDHSLLLAQVTNIQVAEQSISGQRTWIEGDPDMIKGFEFYAKQGKEWLKQNQIYEYRSESELGIPQLMINMPVDYIQLGTGDGKSTEVVSNPVALARVACLFLDLEKGRSGAWGPDCKIAKFLSTPKGKLEKSNKPGARSGDYMYTPPGVGTDKLRYVLENGAGIQVDVTVNLNSYDFTGAKKPREWLQAFLKALKYA